MGSSALSLAAWPRMEVAAWQDTRDTLHLWTQIVGKVRMALAPPVNHWWHVPLYVNSVGLTTSLMPSRGRGIEIVFDFLTHALTIRSTDGVVRAMALEPRSVADFYVELRRHLRVLDVDVKMHAAPVEVQESIPFAEDTQHASYDAEAAHDFFVSLVHSDRVLHQFRSGFTGKASPVHFFWGAFDLAVTRFSGRAAPRHPGGVPNCPPEVMVDAYSDEVSSSGYWPGGDDEGVFYAYAYPEPDGYAEHAIQPAGARYDNGLREFVLPYRDVRQAADPDAYLLEFLTSAHQAAESLGGWPAANGS